MAVERIDYIPGRAVAPCASVVALGFFDGVHLGHRALIFAARERADALGLPLSVFTFPAEDADMKRSAKRLYGTEKKLALLASLGVDYAYVCDFSAVAHISAEDFVKQCLARELRAAVSACGFNFRFGHGAAGDAEMLGRYMRELGRESLTLPPLYLDEELYSSRAVRTHLEKGEVERACALLGAPYALAGRVESGDRRGRTLGFPTVNIPLEENRLCLPSGVYATAVHTEMGDFPSVTNVGTCPTFGARELHVETHLCGFSGDLYGKSIEIGFLSRLRDEREFSSGEELIKQINVDKTKAMEVYKVLQEAGRS